MEEAVVKEPSEKSIIELLICINPKLSLIISGKKNRSVAVRICSPKQQKLGKIQVDTSSSSISIKSSRRNKPGRIPK